MVNFLQSQSFYVVELIIILEIYNWRCFCAQSSAKILWRKQVGKRAAAVAKGLLLFQKFSFSPFLHKCILPSRIKWNFIRGPFSTTWDQNYKINHNVSKELRKRLTLTWSLTLTFIGSVKTTLPYNAASSAILSSVKNQQIMFRK